MDIRCKVNDSHTQLTDLERQVTRRAQEGMTGFPWKGETEEILLEDHKLMGMGTQAIRLWAWSMARILKGITRKGAL